VSSVTARHCAAPRPANEAERQRAVDAAGLLAGTRLAEFDDIVELLAMICNVPIALVSIVDGERQWFQAKVGLQADETHRDVSFCGHAILRSEPFIVEDASLDPRFASNPLVTGPPHIRFYAGVPLRGDDGHAIGTLCAIDIQPRTCDERMRSSLLRLSRIAMLHIEELGRRAARGKA
jgi:GAF domain-containing protein